MNSGGNALGQGNRANSTIGRALQLVIRNVGGGRPGEVDRATLGQPRQVDVLLRRGRGRLAVGAAVGRARHRAGRRAVTLFAAEGPRGVVDQLSRTPGVAGPLVRRGPARRSAHPKLVGGFDAMLVVCPEHARVFREAGWSRAELRGRAADALLLDPATRSSAAPGGIAEGVPDGRSRDAGAEVPARRAADRARRRRRGHVLGDHRRLGRRPGGSAPVTREVRAVTSCCDPTGERRPAAPDRARPAVHARRAARRAARHLQAARRRRSSTGSRSCSPSAASTVQRYAKPTFTKPAPADLRHEIATKCDVVIEALAD